jgi:hypothetical protein
MAYAGRRAETLGDGLERAATRVRRLVKALQPRAVVGAAADGADLLILESVLAVSRTTAIHLVLPTPLDVFVDDSVRPAWRDRFSAVLDQVRATEGSTVTVLGAAPGTDAYRAANQRIVADAAAFSGDDRLIALVVAKEGEGAIVEDLAHRASLQGAPTLRIDPTVDLATRPRCFIVMPFGNKLDPQRGVEVDTDQVYGRILVPALEHAQFGYERADQRVDSGVVLEPMIDSLAHSALVIGDLGTGNFNVGWELGLRHLLRPARTVLIKPTGTKAPFDLSASRVVPYELTEQGVSDTAAIDAWAALAPYLADADELPRPDSPVASVMEVKEWARVHRRSVRDESWENLRRELALARDLADPDLVLQVVHEAEKHAEMTAQRRAVLLADAGVELVRLGRGAEARNLLADVVAHDPAVNYPHAHLFYAQSLYQPDTATTSDYATATHVLAHVHLRRPDFPETRALLGAVAKRRLRLLARGGVTPARADVEAALRHYRTGFEHNLNAFYEGINVIAFDVVLTRRYNDQAAVVEAHELLPIVRKAAALATARPGEAFWVAVTLAECVLHEHLLDRGAAVEPDPAVYQGYRAAGMLRPAAQPRRSAAGQLDFLEAMGLPSLVLDEARRGLADGVGVPVSELSG